MAPVDMFRRLFLSSILLLIPGPTSQLVCALVVGVFTILAAREFTPFYDASMDHVVSGEDLRAASCLAHGHQRRQHQRRCSISVISRIGAGAR